MFLKFWKMIMKKSLFRLLKNENTKLTFYFVLAPIVLILTLMLFPIFMFFSRKNEKYFK